MDIIENLINRLWTEPLLGTVIARRDISTPIPRMTYEEAMSKYGSDKPDTRLGMEVSRSEILCYISVLNISSCTT